MVRGAVMVYYESDCLFTAAPVTFTIGRPHSGCITLAHTLATAAVFDIESREVQKDIAYFQSCLEAILQNSKGAKIFCLLHKMDLVPEEEREQIFRQRESELKQVSRPLEITCFRTSIWDETLYKAWSSIVYSLIPNARVLEEGLKSFCEICEADEVVLFERQTFLVISNATTRPHHDVHRFEKISNIVKQFKLSCSKAGTRCASMELRNANYAAFLSSFTPTTYILVIMSDPNIESAATQLNINQAKARFEEISALALASP